MADGQNSARPGAVVEFPKIDAPASRQAELARLTPVDEAPQARREPPAAAKTSEAAEALRSKTARRRGRLRLAADDARA